ncbi:MAG: GBS Bsp-like repeat-containing protein [[Clostridium] scindens]
MVAAARTSIEIGDKAGTQRTYHYSARNLGDTGGMVGVSVAVWGAQDGQNDLRWYTAKQGGFRRVGGRHQHQEPPGGGGSTSGYLHNP